jgi:hypothetical protein
MARHVQPAGKEFGGLRPGVAAECKPISARIELWILLGQRGPRTALPMVHHGSHQAKSVLRGPLPARFDGRTYGRAPARGKLVQIMMLSIRCGLRVCRAGLGDPHGFAFFRNFRLTNRGSHGKLQVEVDGDG